jgi:hypothetical protein
MTRKELLEMYDVDAQGIIRNPGKFEGEMLYVPYFWDLYMNGCATNETEDSILIFVVEPEDAEAFPELEDKEQVRLWEQDQGFVVEDR